MFSTISNTNFDWSLSCVCSFTFNKLNNVVTLYNFSENDVFAIEPWAYNSCNEELWAVSEWTCVGHWEKTFFIVFSIKILIPEFLLVNWLSSGAVMFSEITSLKHKIRNDSMEDIIFISESILAGTKFPEVSGCFRTTWSYN